MNTYIYTEHDSCIQQMMQKSVVTSRELQHIYLPVCHNTNVYRRDVDVDKSRRFISRFNQLQHGQLLAAISRYDILGFMCHDKSKSNNPESANFHRAGVGPLCLGEGLYDDWRHRARVTSHVSRVTLLSKP